MNTTKEQLVVNNIKLVYEVWNKEFAAKTDPAYMDDFISDGFLALVNAANAYDQREEIKFSTFAYFCIRRQMLVRVRYLTHPRRTVERPLFSLDYEFDDGLSLGEIIGGDDPGFEEAERRIYREQIKDFVEEMLSALTPETREIMEYIFGLNGKPELNYGQIAELYGKKATNRIATRYMRAKKKLRSKFGERWAELHGIQTG